MKKQNRKPFAALLKRKVRDEKGQALLEYGLLALLIAAAVVGVVMVFGTHIANIFRGTTEVTSKHSTADVQAAATAATTRMNTTATTEMQSAIDAKNTINNTSAAQGGNNQSSTPPAEQL